MTGLDFNNLGFPLKSSKHGDSRLEVLFIHRKPMGAQVSIERLFDGVRKALGGAVKCNLYVSPFPSRGLLPRLCNLVSVGMMGRGKVCHITGDVHYLALALPRKNLILTIHDCAILHRLVGWRREFVRLLWFEWPVRRSAVVTTISEASRDDLRNWLPAHLVDKIRVISNCVRSEFIATPKEWNNESPVFLQVGTGWNKNLDRVAESLRGLACRLWIVGPVNETQRALLESCGLDFKCLGKLSDVELVDAYRNSDALIFASLFEGFGLPILEAQATGRPVITSNRGSMPEAAGNGALFVDPVDVAAIRAAVLRVMGHSDLRESLIEQGLLNVRRFHPTSIASSYNAIYQELAGDCFSDDKS